MTVEETTTALDTAVAKLQTNMVKLVDSKTAANKEEADKVKNDARNWKDARVRAKKHIDEAFEDIEQCETYLEDAKRNVMTIRELYMAKEIIKRATDQYQKEIDMYKKEISKYKSAITLSDRKTLYYQKLGMGREWYKRPLVYGYRATIFLAISVIIYGIYKGPYFNMAVAIAKGESTPSTSKNNSVSNKPNTDIEREIADNEEKWERSNGGLKIIEEKLYELKEEEVEEARHHKTLVTELKTAKNNNLVGRRNLYDNQSDKDGDTKNALHLLKKSQKQEDVATKTLADHTKRMDRASKILKDLNITFESHNTKNERNRKALYEAKAKGTTSETLTATIMASASAMIAAMSTMVGGTAAFVGASRLVVTTVTAITAAAWMTGLVGGKAGVVLLPIVIGSMTMLVGGSWAIIAPVSVITAVVGIIAMITNKKWVTGTTDKIKHRSLITTISILILMVGLPLIILPIIFTVKPLLFPYA